MAAVLMGWVAALASSDALAADTTDAFDGRWSVNLVCEDTHAHNSYAKGYTYVFVATIAHGELAGQYGEVDKVASLTLTGKIAPDGAAALFAHGLTGNALYSVGHVEPSMPYRYHMFGTFKGDSGQTKRVELRACVADFAKIP